MHFFLVVNPPLSATALSCCPACPTSMMSYIAPPHCPTTLPRPALAQVYWSVHSTRKQPWPNGPQNPPLLFDVARDHGETAPIDSTSALYKTTLQQLTAARDTHLATVAPVPNQNGRGSDPNNAFCGAPNSQEMHPNLPNCTMNPENWAPAAICTSPACVTRYDKNGLCKGSSSCKMGLACKTRLSGCPLCAGCAKASRTHVASSSFPPTFPWRTHAMLPSLTIVVSVFPLCDVYALYARIHAMHA